MHQIVSIEWSLVTAAALALAKKDLLATHFGLGRLRGIELPEDVELGCRRKI
jgi:hypothetical protein